MLDPSVQEIFEMLPERGETNDYDKADQCLNAYLKPKASVPLERHVFRQTSQNQNETVKKYATRLNKLISFEY